MTFYKALRLYATLFIVNFYILLMAIFSVYHSRITEQTIYVTDGFLFINSVFGLALSITTFKEIKEAGPSGFPEKTSLKRNIMLIAFSLVNLSVAMLVFIVSIIK